MLPDTVRTSKTRDAPPLRDNISNSWGGRALKLPNEHATRAQVLLSKERRGGSKRAQKILPAGALLWAWDADPDYDEVAGEQWLILLPEKWNKQLQYSWRFDPCELGIAGC